MSVTCAEGKMRCGDLPKAIQIMRGLVSDNAVTAYSLQLIVNTLLELYPDIAQKDRLVQLLESVEHVVEEATLLPYTRQMFMEVLMDIEKTIK